MGLRPLFCVFARDQPYNFIYRSNEELRSSIQINTVAIDCGNLKYDDTVGVRAFKIE